MRGVSITLIVVLAVALLLVAGVAVPVWAADQMGASSSSPTGITKQVSAATPSEQERDTISDRRDATPPTDLGGGSERPMSVQEGGEGSGSFQTQALALDSDMLELIRMQDEASSLGF